MLSNIFTSKGWTQPLLREDLFHSFFWWPEQIWSNSQYRQLFTVWGVLRHHAHEVDLLPRVSRFRAAQFAAKAAMGFRRAALVAKLQHIELAGKLCEFAHEESIYFEYYCDQILVEKRIARRQRR